MVEKIKLCRFKFLFVFCSVDLLRKYIYMFIKKDVTRILSVFPWDVSCGEV